MHHVSERSILFKDGSYYKATDAPVSLGEISGWHGLHYATGWLERTRAYPDHHIAGVHNIINPLARMERAHRSIKRKGIIPPCSEEFEQVWGGAGVCNVPKHILGHYMDRFGYSPEQMVDITKDLLWMNKRTGAIADDDEVYIRHFGFKKEGALGFGSTEGLSSFWVTVSPWKEHLSKTALVWYQTINDIERVNKISKIPMPMSAIKDLTAAMGFDEAILAYDLDGERYIAEGIGMNLFAHVYGQGYVTSPTSVDGRPLPIFPGETRKLIMQFAEILGNPIQESLIPFETIDDRLINSIMLTGSERGTHIPDFLWYKEGRDMERLLLERSGFFNRLARTYDEFVRHVPLSKPFSELQERMLVPVSKWTVHPELQEKLVQLEKTTEGVEI